MMKGVKYCLSFLLSLPLLFSCGTGKKVMYKWYGYDDVAYDYSHGKTEENIEQMLKVYEKLLNKQSGTIRRVAPPGMNAEYGYLLINQGSLEEGIKYLEKEMVLYPESSVFIDKIIKQLKK